MAEPVLVLVDSLPAALEPAALDELDELSAADWLDELSVPDALEELAPESRSVAPVAPPAIMPS